MLRTVLIRLSQSRRLQHLVAHQHLARDMARRFVAGETLDHAVAVVRGLNQRHILATLDHLGENVTRQEEAQRATQEYCDLLHRIAVERLESTISVKPTHVGLDFGVDFCFEQMRSIVATAADLGLTVEVDMEGSPYTQATLDVFHRLLDGHRNLRVALQAYLFRTGDDLHRLVERGSSVRLCKGAYDEPATVAWRTREAVAASYSRLMDTMLSDHARQKGFYAALATHDHNLILQAERTVRRRGIGQHEFEFQMLHGVRRDWQQRLAADGYRVRVYVPYGTQWYPYFMRRLAERPANLLFMARAFLGR